MPPEKLAPPFNCRTWNRFEYDVIDKPFDRVGNPAVPPGIVIVKVSPGETEAGASIAIVMSCGWISVLPATTAVHWTFKYWCTVVTACADSAAAVTRTPLASVVANSA